MIGLYLLSTSLLDVMKVIKFGMSLRLEFRWIDYLSIFADAKYEYYYEFSDEYSKNDILEIENEIIQIYQNKRNKYFQTEYFNCDDKNKFNETIIMVLDKNKIKYTVHSTHNFEREYYDNKPIIQDALMLSDNIKPEDHQTEVLLKIDEFYKSNDIAKLVHACGLGKSLLSIFIVKLLHFKLVVFGVPSINLQRQMTEEIMKIFPNYKNILYIGGTCDDNVKSTNNIKIIKQFIKKSKNMQPKFLITTYASCYLLTEINNIDFKIGDEAHHLVGIESNSYDKTYDSFHRIKSKKTLFMTATEKIIENKQHTYSMDNELVFGKYIDKKSVAWAIEKNKITDYNLLILKNTENEINDIIKSVIENADMIEKKELFLSAYMTLKSIEKYTELNHILIYTNTTQSADLIKMYIDMILDSKIINIDISNYYNKSLHSGNIIDINIEIESFKKASWGIISCVYIFGEGYNCPKLYGVVFAENMESEIRIVQCALRPNRLDRYNPGNPNKKAYIIIPYIDTDDFIIANNSYDKCRKIIAKIRNVDENIEYKIKVGTIQQNNSSSSKNKSLVNYDTIQYIDNTDELNKIILRLRYSRALSSIHSEEQDEFNYVREINKELNIQSKEHYADKLIKDTHKNYIDNPEEYFRLKGVWSNWYDFIGVDTKKFIQDKNDWINFCKENNVKSLKDYNKLYKLYDILPFNPLDFYIGCLDIPIELEFKTNRRG